MTLTPTGSTALTPAFTSPGQTQQSGFTSEGEAERKAGSSCPRTRPGMKPPVSEATGGRSREAIILPHEDTLPLLPKKLPSPLED